MSFSGFTPLDPGCAGEDRNKNVPVLYVRETEFLSVACFHLVRHLRDETALCNTPGQPQESEGLRSVSGTHTHADRVKRAMA